MDPRGAVHRGLTDFYDMLLDRRCPGCGGSPPRDGEVCRPCDDRVDRTGVALCLRCLHGDQPSTGVDRVCMKHGPSRLLLAGPPHEAPLDRIIHAFKYEGGSALARWLSALLPVPPGHADSLGREYVLVPVALHPARRARRGYDQAALLAREASLRWGIPVVDALARTRDHEPQARQDPERRRVNVRGAFRAVARAAVAGRPVLLVDDVATTGSTLLEAAQALEEAGATWVLSLSVAHGGLVRD